MAEADSRPFSEGFHQESTRPDNDNLWEPLLADDPKILRQLIERGQMLYTARLRHIRRSVTRFGFAVQFEGFPTLAINLRGDGEIGEYVRELGYEIAYCYVDGQQNGALRTFVTLFSKEADVSKIAQKFGGGGHRNAAGFSFERGRLPFPPGAEVIWQR
jgi:hypothetical protein